LSKPTAAQQAAELVTRLLGGDRAALARVITHLERDGAGAREIDTLLAPHVGRAYTVGVTGAPGAGKSTIVGSLLAAALAQNQRTAVLALDPVSPLTHGAILGDRLRMEHITADERVFVRSMTADAHGGGLSVVTPLAIRALDAAGWPWIFVETVGVGQSEIDIVEAAATTVVVLNPGWGDEVQSIKAGLMEVADIFVINKCDRDGAAETRRDLERLIAQAPPSAWKPPIVDTIANQGSGVDALWQAINDHRGFQEQSQLLPGRRDRFLRLALRSLAQQSLNARIERFGASARFKDLLGKVTRGEDSIHSAADKLLKQLLKD
jgi:LAO/AO transport system kinase